VFPPEPPVALRFSPERRGAGKGTPQAWRKRTLASEHRYGTRIQLTGGAGGNTIVVPAGEL